MRSPFLTRLLIPLAMAVFLTLSLAYWWLENLPHEMFGTAMFALMAWHLVVNRMWFRNLSRGRYDLRRVVAVGLHLLLIINMLVLLATSIVISKSIFAALPIPDSIYLREVHWFSAYWVMLIVGVHLGLHWARVMALFRSLLGISTANGTMTWSLRFATLLLFGVGVWSFQILDVFGKLTFTYSLDVWNFRRSVTPFFGHWASVVALPATLTHYGMTLWRHRSSRRPARAAASQ
jgi:hypothetical protein